MKSILVTIGISIGISIGIAVLLGLFVFNGSERQVVTLKQATKKIEEAGKERTELVQAKKTNTNININKPKERIQIKADRVDFYDGNSHQIKSIHRLSVKNGKHWSRVTKSANSKYVAINNINNYNQNDERIEDATLNIYNNSGEKLWSVDNHHLSIIKLSPDGRYIAGVEDLSFGESPVYVYDYLGRRKSIKKASRCWVLLFLDDNRFALLSHSYTQENHYVANIKIHSNSGDVLWKRDNIGYGMSCGYKLSSINNTLKVTHYKFGEQVYSLKGVH